jgi:multidrug resistance efflux pump
MTTGEISPGDVLRKLAQARAACSAGAVTEALGEVETAREWMRRMRCSGSTVHTHHAFGAVDATLAQARAAVREGRGDAGKHIQQAIMQAQNATQNAATADPHSNWG